MHPMLEFSQEILFPKFTAFLPHLILRSPLELVYSRAHCT